MSDNTSSNFTALAKSLGFNPQTNYFPVNSLRLLYLIIAEHFAPKNPEITTKINQLIIASEKVFQARMTHRSESRAPTPPPHLTAAAPALRELYAVIDTPVVRQSLAQLFTFTYPLQDELFLQFYQKLQAEQAFSITDLSLVLKIRAMDATVVATLLTELLRPTLKFEFSLDELQASLQWHLSLAYQLNDLVDTVIYAKSDLEAEHFSLFQVIRKVAPEATAAKELIKQTLTSLVEQTTLVKFPDALQNQVTQFYDSLMKVVVTNS